MDDKHWSGKRVLVTGHTGFKGSWLTLYLLQKGAEVTGISLPPNTKPSLFLDLNIRNQIRHITGDIRNEEFIKKTVAKTKPEVVFHLAAQPIVKLGYKEPSLTWSTNVMGTINLLEALRSLNTKCNAVIVTTDKVYENKEWTYGYRENDRLGGYDPYSSSKAATELVVSSWRRSFCGTLTHQTPLLKIASARAGNVIGGGDWAPNRIIPDAIRALSNGEAIEIRNPKSTRPWQHVLESLSGYLCLAEYMSSSNHAGGAYNFGPNLDSNRSVEELINEILKYCRGTWINKRDKDEQHEAAMLNLSIDRARHELGWRPKWDFETAVMRSINWYNMYNSGKMTALQCCNEDLANYF